MAFCFLKGGATLVINEWAYNQELGKVYVKVDQFQYPYQRVSVDPLGHIEVKAFTTSRKAVKTWSSR